MGAILGVALAAAAASAQAAVVTLTSDSPRQGDPVVVRCAPPAQADEVAIEWKGALVPMAERAPGVYEGLVGVDLFDPPGAARVGVVARRGEERIGYEAHLRVVSREFPEQRLSLPRAQAEFDDATLARIEREKRDLDARLARVSRPVRWELPFLPPVTPWRPAGFGARRIINGEPRSPHAGVDVKAPEGASVLAAAAGIVVFAGEQFFGGRSVVVDHGGGVFTLYYHLRNAAVAEGQAVARGDTIGAVGSTGRAAGPHLHFAVRAPGGRIDPARLMPGDGEGGAGR